MENSKTVRIAADLNQQQNEELKQTCKRLEHLINNLAIEVNNIQSYLLRDKAINSLILDYAQELKIPDDVKTELNRIYGKKASTLEEKLLYRYEGGGSHIEKKKED